MSQELSGYLAAWAIVLVWSFWLIVSRIAPDSALTIYDLAAMRYGLACLIALPVCLRWRSWQALGAKRIAILSFVLGPIYILMVFAGFIFAPAAHGGIFMNGMLPVIGILIGLIFLARAPGRRQLGGAALILVSALILAWDGRALAGPQVLIGDAFFIIGAVFFSVYILLTERWSLDPVQIIFCGTVVNAALYLPIWLLFLPSGLAEASREAILLQGIYQGFVPNLIGLLLIAYAARRIGNGQVSAILAAVPGLGALLGALLLGEALSLIAIMAIALLTSGLLLSIRRIHVAP